MAAAVGQDRVEPNLTPLLDVVLQLIMFFMITVNFVSEQINQNVLLPESSSAQEIMPTGESDVLVINIEVVRQDKVVDGEVVRDAHGKPVKEMVLPKTTKIIFTGTEEIVFKEGEEQDGLGRAQRALRDQGEHFRLRASRRLKKPVEAITELEVPVIIRADAETNFGLVFPLIAQCSKEGFTKIHPRAQMVRR